MTSTSDELENEFEDGYDSIIGEIPVEDGDIKAV
jgi:hypothetical protein